MATILRPALKLEMAQMAAQNSTLIPPAGDRSTTAIQASSEVTNGEAVEPIVERHGPAEADPCVGQIVEQVLRVVRQRKTTPRATYRCQFHNGFGFRDATAIVPYLHALGISHIYASPVWHARPGSGHGYDVCNHQEFDPELGGEAGWNDWQSVLRRFEMGVLLDVVPNHMSTHAENPWWTDILENGPSSPYARFFDIDWQPVKQELDGHVLLPVLGRQYGDALEAGELSVAYESGGLFLRYFDRWLPLDPKTAPLVLGRNLDALRGAGRHARYFGRIRKHPDGARASATAYHDHCGRGHRAAARQASDQTTVARARE